MDFFRWSAYLIGFDEQECERCSQRCGDPRRLANDGHHRAFEPSVVDGGTEERQRVHSTDARVDHAGVVVFPPSLVLFTAPVMVDREDNGSEFARSGTQPHRRATTVRTDLDER